MKSCICGINKKSTSEKSDIYIGAIVYPLMFALLTIGLGIKAAAFFAGALFILIVLLSLNYIGSGHKRTCALRGALIRLCGFAGFISPIP